MKLKKLLCIILSMAMVVGMLPTAAFAEASDIKLDVVLTEETLGGRPGVKLDIQLKTGTVKIGTANVVFTYDTSVFALTDKNGTVLAFPTKSPYVLNAAQLTTNDAFDDENQTLVRENTDGKAQVAVLRNTYSEVAFASMTSLGTYFLSYQDGKSIADVTTSALRLATYEEALRLAQSDVIYVCDEEYNEFEYGTSGGDDDTEGWASNISFGESFDFAKPALSGAPVISGTAKVGETLTADVSALNDSINIGYQWCADGVEISGAAYASYTLTAQQVGKKITVRVTATDASEYSGTVESLPTAAVTNAAQTAPVLTAADILGTTDTTITVVQNENWEYSRDSGSSWQSESVFTGLKPDTDYSICVRRKAIPGYDASAASNAITAKTRKATMDDTAKGTLSGYDGTYDGSAHDAVIGSPMEGYSIAGYSTTSAETGFSTTMPQVKDVADSKTVWVKLRKSGYEDKTFALTVSVRPKPLTDRMIVLDDLQDTYDGNAHDVHFTVKDGDYTLGEQDYTVLSGGSAVNVAATTLRIEGKGNYSGQVSAVWTLSAKTVDSAMIDAIADQVYTGNALCPVPVVAGLKENTDYTVSYRSNIYVGSGAVVTITGHGNYQGTADKAFQILPAEQTPAITSETSLTKGGNTLDLSTLVSDAKGTVSFALVSGDAATLSGSILTAGEQEGTVVLSVSITAKDENGDGTAEYNAYQADNAITVHIVDKTTAALPGGVSQTGCIYGETLPDPTFDAPEGASVSIFYNGTLTKDGSSYSSSAKPTEAGSYTATVTCETATHIYTATSESFTIAQRSIADMTVTLSEEAKEYNGMEQHISVVSVGNLSPSDYEVSGAASGTNAGTYTVTVTGKGNYTGTAEKQWRITPKPISILGAAVLARDYEAGNLLVSVDSVSFSGASLNKDIDYTATGRLHDVNAGESKTVTVTVTLKNNNYTLPETTFQTTVTIHPAAKQELADILVNQKYSVTSEQAVSIGGVMPVDAGTLSYAKGSVSTSGAVTVLDWSITEETVRFTLSGGAVGDTVTLPIEISSTNYAPSTLSVKITLTDKDAQSALSIVSSTNVTYGETLTLQTAGGSGSGEVIYAVTNGTGTASVEGNILTGTGAGTVSVIATKAADENYSAISSTPVTITIEKATPTGTPSYKLIQADGKTLADAALSVGTITPEGSIKWVEKDGVTILPDTTKVTANTDYTWCFTPNDQTNYHILTGVVRLWSVETRNDPPSPVGPGVQQPIAQPEEPEEPETPQPVFRDIPTDAYYSDAVYWAVENGITDGIGQSLFDPDGTCTRAQIVTLLWRTAGSPEPNTANGFTDVPENAYYAKAVAWAVENGITEGVGDNRFAPDAACTRAQAVTFLFRAYGDGLATSAPAFRDVDANAYYANAVAWAAENGITGGIGNDLFGGELVCTRAQIVTFLYRARNLK